MSRPHTHDTLPKFSNSCVQAQDARSSEVGSAACLIDHPPNHGRRKHANNLTQIVRTSTDGIESLQIFQSCCVGGNRGWGEAIEEAVERRLAGVVTSIPFNTQSVGSHACRCFICTYTGSDTSGFEALRDHIFERPTVSIPPGRDPESIDLGKSYCPTYVRTTDNEVGVCGY